MAGIIGIVRSWGIIKSAVGLAASEFKSKGKTVDAAVKRTRRDISMKIIAVAFICLFSRLLVFGFVVFIQNCIVLQKCFTKSPNNAYFLHF